MMMMATTSIIIIREKYKISPYSLPNLQIAICCIKINSKVPVVGENNNLFLEINFRPLT
jgi:hypothetical protein